MSANKLISLTGDHERRTSALCACVICKVRRQRKVTV